MAKKLKTHEASRLLSFGERVRENPKTTLFSVPIFLVGCFWFTIKNNREKFAGSFGHMGITFKNYYKHNLKLKLFLKLAIGCFRICERHTPLKDRPTVLLKLGQSYIELGRDEIGEDIFNKAVKVTKDMFDNPQLGYVLSHRGRLYLSQGKMDKAWSDFEKALRFINKGIKNNKDSMYYHIWLSGLELDIAEFMIKSGRENEAIDWAKKAQKRAKKYGLSTRVIDARKCLERILKT